MPAWLLRFLPHIAIVAAIVAAVWWLDHRGYQRAMADRDARDTKMLNEMRSELRKSEQALAASIASAAADYQAQRDAIARTGTTLQPIILKEAARDPRLSNPAAGVTAGMFEAINRARATGACAATATGRIECALPAAAAAGGDVDR